MLLESSRFYFFRSFKLLISYAFSLTLLLISSCFLTTFFLLDWFIWNSDFSRCTICLVISSTPFWLWLSCFSLIFSTYFYDYMQVYVIEFQDAARVCLAVGVVLIVLDCAVDIVYNLVQLITAFGCFSFVLGYFSLQELPLFLYFLHIEHEFLFPLQGNFKLLFEID